MKMKAKRNRLGLLAAGLVLVSSPALALEINNNTGYTLTVTVTCGASKDIFEVSANRVGDCPSSVCVLNAACQYEIDAPAGDGSCSGKIDGGSGLQVEVAADGIKCLPYGG